MKNLFKSIQDLFLNQSKDDFIDLGLKPIKMFDLNKGQLDDPESFELLTLPAILFDWNIDKDENINDGKSIASITLYLVYEQTRDSSSHSRRQDDALKIFDFLEIVHDKLEGIESEDTGKLAFINEQTISLGGIVTAFAQSYSCSYFGRVYNQTRQFGLSDQDINASITGNLVTPVDYGLTE